MLFALPLLLVPPSAIYHVSVAGRDTNPGTEAAPWRTIQYACDHVASGDGVVVHGGVYAERVTVRVPMALAAAAGEAPTIDGTGLAVPTEDAALVLIKNVDRVAVTGFEIRNYRTTVSSRVPMGILVRGKADGVSLVGNHVHHIGNDGTNRNSINAFGLAVYGDSKRGAITNLRIEGNEIDHTKTGWSETLTVNGNVDGFRVVGNAVHDADNIGIVAIGFEGTSPIKGKDQARNGLIAENRIENVSSGTNPAYRGERSAGGVYVDGGTGITIERNVVRAADLGIEVASEHKGKTSSNVVVRSNLVTGCNVCGVSIGGYGSNRGGTLNCTIVNNTLVRNDALRTGTGEFLIQYNTQGNLFGNNVLAASAQGVVMTTVTGRNSRVGVVSDANLFDAPGVPAWNWKGRAYDSLTAFRAGTGFEAHSLFGAPGFVGADDFRLAADSPARDAGWSFGSAVLGTLDLAGSPRVQGAGADLGAYESARI